MIKKLTILLILCSYVLCGCVLSGCGPAASANAGENGAEKSDAEKSGTAKLNEAGNDVAGGVESAVGTGAAGEVTVLDVSDMFSNRDREIGYDESECVQIVLQGNTAQAGSPDVKIAGNVVTVTAAGSYLISGSLQGQLVVQADKEDKIQLILDGVNISCESSAALYVEQADKVFVTTAAGSDNSLETTGEYVAIDDHNIDGAVHARDDITFNGEGSLRVSSAVGHGIVCKNDLVITGGDYEISAGKHGLQGKDSVRIANGSLVINAGTDGIHSGNDEDETVGFTYIAGGTLTIAAGDDGVHSDTQLVVAGGSIHVTKSYEGLEGACIEIVDGDISVRAEDDGLNAAGGNDGSGGEARDGFGGNPFAANAGNAIIISGGKITVDADGDGIDSNGGLYVNAGAILVYGPTNGGNGALDYNGEAIISGGTVIALGASQMAENFGAASGQCAMLVSVSGMQAAGTAVELRDASGSVLLSCVAEKTYNSAVFSCQDIRVGETYTVIMGDETVEVEMTETIYGSGMGFGHGGGFDRGNPDRNFDPKDFDREGMEPGEPRPEGGRKGRGKIETPDLPSLPGGEP